jgi:hypothetical protein
VPLFHFALLLAVSSPDALLQQLRSQGAADISLSHARLASGPAEHAILRYTDPKTGAHALILAPSPSGWREAAHFNTWWSFEPRDAARLLELRSLIDPAVTDLIVRTRSGGTETALTQLDFFRLRDGSAVNVLSLKEYESAMEHPSGDVTTTVAAVEYPAPGRILVRTAKDPGPHRSCTLYVWDAPAFRFSPRPCP